MALDPLQIISRGNLATSWPALGDYANARGAAQHVLVIDPHSDYESLTIPLSYLLEGEPQRTLELANQMTDEDDKLVLSALAQQALGHRDAAGAPATRFIARHSDEPYAVADCWPFAARSAGRLPRYAGLGPRTTTCGLSATIPYSRDCEPILVTCSCSRTGKCPTEIGCV